MAIEIQRRDGLYTAIVTSPHDGRVAWRAPHPMRASELVDRLRDLGCHTTDIGDAFHAAYPRWLDDIGG
jgi:hypothetical protein